MAQGLAFAYEPLQDAGVAGDDPGVEGLDGDEFSGMGIGRPVDLAHTAPPNLRVEPVALIQGIVDVQSLRCFFLGKNGNGSLDHLF